MYEYYFTFRSVTYAQGAQRMLDAAAIPNSLTRSPKAIQNRGCGYSVRVRSGFYQQTKDILERGRAGFGGVFCRMPDGIYEEVRV